MDIVEKIKELIIQTEKSKIYKSQLITDYYNEVFNTNEKPTNCGSCLRVKLLKLKNWVKEQEDSSSQPTQPEHLTHQQAGAEITIINNAGIDPDSDISKLSNDRIIDELDANDEVKELVEQYPEETNKKSNKKKKK